MKDLYKEISDLYELVKRGQIDLERAKVLLSILDRMSRD